MKQFAGAFNGKALFLMTFLNRSINMVLPYFREASLLSISSNFLVKHSPFPPDTAYV